MPTIKPNDVTTAEFHQILLGTVAPRPIAFVSSVSKSGDVNLSPFSFFNVFSARPPIMVFSPARRVRDNTIKHTLENIREVPEVTVNIVNFSMVEQTSLASTEYDRGVNEFLKAGFTPGASSMVKPPYVKESPAAYECKVLEVKALGHEGGAGNLVICEVLLVHLADDLYSRGGVIDPHRLDAVARMGGNWYCRAQGDNLFEVVKPIANRGMGIDQIPKSIRNSRILTGNHLGKLGNVAHLPSESEIIKFSNEPEVSAILDALDHDTERLHEELHKLAAQHLDAGDAVSAWKVLLQDY